MRPGALFPIALMTAVLPTSLASAAADGAKVYQRCAACHLPTGKGVPGAFPPLQADVRALAGIPEGRRYLVLAVTSGLSGPLTVEGKTYRGMMPPQSGLDDEAVAAVLSHVTGEIAGGGRTVKPFTAAEVRMAQDSGAGLDAAAVARLQPKLSGK
ncbi:MULTISPECIES: c-type cytochrome [unclassified Sphingomonas]|uniref:c-type cytochrome n=1 Tax=unclassified Sphingomonas TaxID=196159 RepID=UPI000B1BFCBC|nr:MULTISPECIES: cytochrome c [unclassified Sphingomonas]